MDTKLKKSKCAVSFLCFVLGVSLLLSSGVLGLGAVLGGSWRSIMDALNTDYQNTTEFKERVSYELSYLLNQAVNPDDPDAASTLGGENLLYHIMRNGQTVGSNAAWMDSPADLPEGYNFLLYFDGEQVTIWKDGQELDVYGDGYYRPEKQDWYVPGYRNLPAASFYWGEAYVPLDTTVSTSAADGTVPEGDLGQVRICMAAAKEPVYYPLASGERNPLYRIVQGQQGNRIYLAVYALFPAAGLALFIVYLVLRKAKAQADRGIAWVGGKIWLEIKLVLLIPLIYVTYWSCAALLCWICNGWQYGAIFFVLPCFWCWYLYVNDLRYNGTEFFRNNFCAACVRLFRNGGLKYPVQARMSRRANWQFVAVLPFVAASFVFWVLMPVVFGFRWYRVSGYNVLWVLLALAGVALIAVLVYFYRRQKADVTDLGVLLDRIQAASGGELSGLNRLPEDSDLRDAAEQLSHIERGLRAALDEQMKSERLKVELIANVSHDLKTPLTSIISYAELLNQEEDLPEHVRDYVRVLNDKAQRLQTMVREVFEVSKAASGNLPVNREALDLAKLLRQTLADMSEAIEASPVTIRAQLPEEPVFILADGDRLYRVFQNLIQNALKYSLEGSRVYLTLKTSQSRAEALVRNTSREELPDGVDFTARFVRGDESRTDGGSGLGLSIASTFTEACGGAFRVETDADRFTAAVTFPLTQERPVTMGESEDVSL